MNFWRKTEIDKIEVFGIVFLIDSIQALLSAPNPDDPLSENIAKHWKTNEVEAVETGNVVSLHLAVSSKLVDIATSIDGVTLICSIFLCVVLLLNPAAKEWTRLYASGA